MSSPSKKIYDNLSFTHKTYEKQCEVLSIASICLRAVSVTLVVAVLMLQFWQLLYPSGSKTLTLISLALLVIEVGVAFFQLNFNYDKLLDQHRNTAKNLLSIKNRMIVDMQTMTSQQLSAYVTELNVVYFNAPQTGELARLLANRK
jgi:hypothetical protein